MSDAASPASPSPPDLPARREARLRFRVRYVECDGHATAIANSTQAGAKIVALRKLRSMIGIWPSACPWS